MIALKGTIQGDTIVLEDEDIQTYNGRDVIITILDYPYYKNSQKSYHNHPSTIVQDKMDYSRLENKSTSFIPNCEKEQNKRRLGIANGKFCIPDDIDVCNDEIAKLFGVNES